MAAARFREFVHDGQTWREDQYDYQSCKESLIRGPFNGRALYPSGKPVYMPFCRTAFKVVGNTARATNKRKSKKHSMEMDIDWREFAEALGYEVV